MTPLNHKVLAACAAAALCCGNIAAQENTFDLSIQRSEVQHIAPVPGKKLNHQGLVINPVPQQLQWDGQTTLNLSAGITLKDKQGKFSGDFTFLPQTNKGVKLAIDYGNKAARKNGVKALSGAYALQINEKGISIIGYDERGAFYGIQTLKQILESPVAANKQVPCLSITDYPSFAARGVVEGFYGTPWSHAVRLSLIDFYGKFKMNTYLYGPKDDPYHSCPNWRLPYPEKEAKQIGELIDACQRNRVDFVWAIHPGQDIKWNEEDYQNLLRKFNGMYDLGVRSFAVFFDDISGEGTNPDKQIELLNRLTREFVEEKGDVAPLTVCPTDYSKLWANPTPQGSLAIYGNKLHPSINVFWTGDVVCSDLTRETMEWLNSRIKRPGYYWWNYPVTDYVRHILLQGPVYGLEPTLTSNELFGIVSNPMEHGEASKLALYGVADYAWNAPAYNPIDNWERGLEVLVPEAKEAYRTFAIHSADTENGYRRDESWETKTFRLADWDEALANALYNEFDKVEKTQGLLEQGCSNKELLKELTPWLDEFTKLGKRGKGAIELLQFYRDGQEPSALWNAYVQNLMSDEELKSYQEHKSGTLKLQPFYENAMDDIAHAFLQQLIGEVPKDYRCIGSFQNSQSSLSKLMLDNDSTTFYTSGYAQKANDWIGIDLRAVRDVSEIFILQGRNSKDDVDYFDHALLECSADGMTWTTLIDDMRNQYIIEWKGEPVKARYVRIRRLESKKTNYASVRTFDINPIRIDELGFKIETTNRQQAVYAFDSSLGTSCTNEGTFRFGVPEGVKGYSILLGKLKEGADGKTIPAVVRQLKADGTMISETKTNSSFITLDVSDGVSAIELVGDFEIFEIITQK